MDQGNDFQSNNNQDPSSGGEELSTKFFLDPDKKRILIIVGLVLLGVVSLLIIFALVKNSRGSAEIDKIKEVENISPIEVMVTKDDIKVEPPETDPFPHDKDRDGISDQVEFEAGTSDTEFDTDKDGLSDKLEIEVWKTDPTNPDTDGDGYNDGEEVIRGFNPNGEGKFVPFTTPKSEVETESSVETST